MARIVSVQNAGDAWHSEKFNTWNWPYRYEFDDGTVGIANHQSDTCPFNPGDDVEVVIKGKDQRGNTKLSVKKPQQNGGGYGGGGGYNQRPPQSQGGYPQQGAPQQRSAPPQGGSKRNEGIRVGMAINNATQLIASGRVTKDDGSPLPLTTKAIRGAVYAIASDILRVSEKLEAGELFDPNKTKQPAPPPQNNVSQYEESVNQNTGPHQAPPQNQPPPRRYEPGSEDGHVALDPNEEEPPF